MGLTESENLKEMGVKMGRKILLMKEIEELLGSTITGKNENQHLACC